MSLFFDRRECISIKCEKYESYGVAIKDFQGEMILRKNFRFCSNSEAVLLTFKYCKVEQFIIPKTLLKDVLSKGQNNCMAMPRKCLIEENEDIVNIYGCEKGKLIIYLFIFLFISIHKALVLRKRTYARTLRYLLQNRSLEKTE